ncbi:MAG TPA: DNA alkylation repair protein [Candidatus Limnocylindrales bacterium]
MSSEVTARAQALVAERLPQARGLGDSLGELIDYPEEFVEALRHGLKDLADEPYRREQERVNPGSGAILGVRQPLLAAVMRQIRAPLHETSPALALNLAERLVAEEEREFVFFAHLALDRVLPRDPERAWQLMRRMARDAHDWISVDTLAPLFARGILAERVRWAEIEQLVFSASEWERRMVGATIASLPFELPRERRSELVSTPALALIRTEIGDASETVRKSLSWALRSWREVDPRGVDELLESEARRASESNDGNRAWVIRDAMKEQRTPVPQPVQARIRTLLAGVRRAAGNQSTSEASQIAAKFVGFEGMSDSAVGIQGERQRMAVGR